MGAAVAAAMSRRQFVIIQGERGLGQVQCAVAAAAQASPGWRVKVVAGDWRRSGYLCGFHDVTDDAMDWCSHHRASLITKHQQSLKRLLPSLESPHFSVPKDLTWTSQREERTRFYHHEYQGKLLFGLAEFLVEYHLESGLRSVICIDDAGKLSPTAVSLLQAISRLPGSRDTIKFVLADYDQRVFLDGAEFESIFATPLEFSSFTSAMGLVGAGEHKAKALYRVSRGNPMRGRAALRCEEGGIPIAANLELQTLVDLYLSTLDSSARSQMLASYVDVDCPPDDLIQLRNYETSDVVRRDALHTARHLTWSNLPRAREAPLVLFHALSIVDNAKRLACLTEASDLLQSVGLYDTWLSCFSELFADIELRGAGSGEDQQSGAFIGAAFVLYSLGAAKASIPYLDDFYQKFPKSRFAPTALYAQSMTYGRYQQPVNLDLAEQFAQKNLSTIEWFKGSRNYEYIKVFAENAYAYIKARQGKFGEALRMCTDGSARMLEVYGPETFKLHQSILIYNTSQIYELTRCDDLAERQLKLAIEADPFYGEYFNDLGNLLSRDPARLDEALAAYSRAIELCPPYFEAHLNRAQALISAGRLVEARMDLDRALLINPLDWRSLLALAVVELHEGNYRDACKHLRSAIDINPDSAELHCNMGLALSEAGDHALAISHYRTAISIHPQHSDSHNNLAIELFIAGRGDEALHHATIAAKLRPNDRDLTGNRDGITRGNLEGEVRAGLH